MPSNKTGVGVFRKIKKYVFERAGVHDEAAFVLLGEAYKTFFQKLLDCELRFKQNLTKANTEYMGYKADLAYISFLAEYEQMVNQFAIPHPLDEPFV